MGLSFIEGTCFGVVQVVFKKALILEYKEPLRLECLACFSATNFSKGFTCAALTCAGRFWSVSLCIGSGAICQRMLTPPPPPHK